MTPTNVHLKPNDAVRVKFDIGEFYADFPAQVILVASQDSTGRVVTLDEFVKDFVRRLGPGKLSAEQQQAYKAHFAVVGQAVEQGLQYPIRFEKVATPAKPADLLRCRPREIELVDGSGIEKTNSGGVGNTIASLFKDQSSSKAAPTGRENWPTTNNIHDQAKFTDIELVMSLAHSGPPIQPDIEIVYLHHTSILPYHNYWYRLKRVVPEAAFDIIDSLHFPKHNHAGYSWEEIADMIEKNDPRKPLWYTHEQSEALIAAAQKVYQMEQERGFEALTNYSDPDVLQQIQNNPNVMPGLVDLLKKDEKK